MNIYEKKSTKKVNPESYSKYQENKLRYLLTHRRGFSLWQSAENVWLCGFTDWKKQNLNSVNNNSSLELKNALIGSNELRENFKQPSDITSQVTAVFNHRDNPILFADLVAIVSNLQGIKEPLEIPETEILAERLLRAGKVVFFRIGTLLLFVTTITVQLTCLSAQAASLLLR